MNKKIKLGITCMLLLAIYIPVAMSANGENDKNLTIPVATNGDNISIPVATNGDNISIPVATNENIIPLKNGAIDKNKTTNLLSKKFNIQSNKLEIVDAASSNLSVSGKRANDVKAVDKATGKIIGISVDNNGTEIDAQALIQNEAAAKKAKYGKLEPALAEKIKTTGNQNVSVIIWLNDTSKDKFVKKNYAVNLTNDKNISIVNTEIDTLINQTEQDKASKVNNLLTTATTKLRQKGLKNEKAVDSPVILANLTANQINDAASLAEVDAIYPNEQAVSQLNIARPTVLADVAYNRGIGGYGTKVGEIEVGGGIYPYNPYLASPIELDTLNTCTSDHAAAVAGIIRSWHPYYFGIAPGSWLRIGGSCGGWGSELTSAADRAVSWGASVLTNSWGYSNADGNMRYEDRYFDNIAWTYYRTPVIAAGNSYGRVTSPGLSYNSITVGAYDDRNTYSRSDNVMAAFSGYIDGNNYMQKPEVAAPGVSIITTKNTYPYYADMGSGTSYATPIVTGEIADIMQRNNNLKYWPESVKAIVMASASHNIEGSSELSDKDGAGGINVERADNIAVGYNGRWGGNYYPCSSTSPYVLTTMPLTAGVKTRVVMAFSTDPNYAYYSTRPSADLDIQIKNPSGTVIDGSYSSRNTYEIVEFTPTVTGNYQLVLNKFSCSSSKYLGWAWYKGN